MSSGLRSSYRTIPLTNRAYDVLKSCYEERHTYATRAIERGIMPKVLQRLLGHSSIKTTMDRYVHVTDASLTNAVKQFEQSTTMAS